jgi:hypothetical protein
MRCGGKKMGRKSEYNPTKRAWFKIWVDPWLDGSTRDELTREERASWIDLLALATRSRYPGIIAAGKAKRGYIGYPLERVAAMVGIEPEALCEFLKTCSRLTKIKVIVRCSACGHKCSLGSPMTRHKCTTSPPQVPRKKVVIHVVKWATYQSDYLRQRELGARESSRKVTDNVTPNLALEGEGEESEKRGGPEDLLVALYNNLHGVNKPATARRYIRGALANGIGADAIEAALQAPPHKREIFVILDDLKTKAASGQGKERVPWP